MNYHRLVHAVGKLVVQNRLIVSIQGERNLHNYYFLALIAAFADEAVSRADRKLRQCDSGL